MEIELPCIKGNAKIQRGYIGEYERPRILTGRKRKLDSLHWSLADAQTCYIQGMYKGSYADATVKAQDLYDALIAIGMVETANRVFAACEANNHILKPQKVAS